MINNYEIKRINNQEVLYIYINDSYEFAKLYDKKKLKKIKKNISDFIENNKIKFNGSMIVILASGLVIGNMYLNYNMKVNSEKLDVQVPIEEVIVNESNNIEDIEIKETENVEEKSKSTKENTVKENSKTSSNKKSTKTSTSSKSTTSTKSNNTTSTSSENKTSTPNIENTKVDASSESTKELNESSNKSESTNKKEYKESVTVFRTNGEVLTLELEDYLINVVAAEMPASFSNEALKAQTVLARTYAKKAISRGKTLTDNESTQSYKDNSQLKKIWGSNYDKYYNKIKKAVEATEGQVLTYNGSYIEAVYHSTSNGFTESSENVWGNEYPYLITVESSLDKNVKNYEVTKYFSYSKLSSKLGYTVNSDTEFNIIERNKSNRVSSVSINEKTYTGVKLRSILGLRSADFDFEKTEDGINITTRGYGHGVGMSQYGANELAKDGKSYTYILKTYYPGTSLVKD